MKGKKIAIFVDNTTALCYLRKRGDKVMEALQTGRRTVTMGRKERDYTSSQIYRGEEEQGGGHLKQKRTDCDNRMDAEHSSVPSPLETMGSPANRLICDDSDNKTSMLLRPSSRSKCNRCGCPPTGMEPSGHLCISSVRDHKESDQQSEKSNELQSDSSSTMVATKGMVPRLNRPAGRHSKSAPSKERSPPA